MGDGAMGNMFVPGNREKEKGTPRGIVPVSI